MLSAFRLGMLLIVMGCVPAAALAHPGHGASDTGPVHYIVEPVHAIPLALVISLGIFTAVLAGLVKLWRVRVSK